MNSSRALSSRLEIWLWNDLYSRNSAQVCGSDKSEIVIPAQDYDFLYKAGVAAIFGPGTSVAHSAKIVMQLLMQE